jgi:hypothetical protein
VVVRHANGRRSAVVIVDCVGGERGSINEVTFGLEKYG